MPSELKVLGSARNFFAFFLTMLCSRVPRQFQQKARPTATHAETLCPVAVPGGSGCTGRRRKGPRACLPPRSRVEKQGQLRRNYAVKKVSWEDR